MTLISRVDINDITKRYQGASFDSLEAVSFSIFSGQKLGIFGPNGAGKTTLIGILCGLIEPSVGQVEYLTKSGIITGSNLKRLIGFVPQEYAFYHELSPVQNLSYFGRLYGLSKKEIKERTHSLLSILGLSDVADKPIRTFSGGMKRKVNLAIGLVHRPSILFLDEPTVGVDVQSKISIIEFLKEVNQQGTTIIYSSHHLSEAEEFCDQIILIDKGRMVAKGTMVDLKQEHDVVDLQGLFIKLTLQSLQQEDV